MVIKGSGKKTFSKKTLKHIQNKQTKKQIVMRLKDENIGN